MANSAIKQSSCELVWSETSLMIHYDTAAANAA